jgi:hypothetical protein
MSEPLTAIDGRTHHCHHFFGDPDLASPDCCICLGAPCTRVQIDDAVLHGQREIELLNHAHEADIAYVLEHGKREEALF